MRCPRLPLTKKVDLPSCRSSRGAGIITGPSCCYLFIVYIIHVGKGCQEFFKQLSVARDMSGFVAHDLSGLRWSSVEVTDETDRDATGDPEDAI